VVASLHAVFLKKVLKVFETKWKTSLDESSGL